MIKIYLLIKYNQRIIRFIDILKYKQRLHMQKKEGLDRFEETKKNAISKEKRTFSLWFEQDICITILNLSSMQKILMHCFVSTSTLYNKAISYTLDLTGIVFKVSDLITNQFYFFPLYIMLFMMPFGKGQLNLISQYSILILNGLWL